MKTSRASRILAGVLCASAFALSSHGATTILSDNYNVTGSGTGFALNTGINTGINPPTTRLTGTAASGLRYIHTGTKATNTYSITSSKLKVTSAANPGRFTFSSNGSTAFDFGSALGIAAATPSNPVVYDLSISIDNDSAGIQRCSFALGTAEGDATTWDFGFQVYRTASGNNNYVIGKRIDTAASGLAADLNSVVNTMGASTYGTEITILMRVTDAGSESSNFHSRVQLSLNGGSTWFYDTATDSELVNGWGLNGTGRVVIWDIAPDAGNVTYDNFSLNWVSGPRTWTGGGTTGNWSDSANWGGAVPGSGDKLTFTGTTRQTNTNNLSGLSVPWVNLANGGFSLYGNQFTVSSALTNSGNNALLANLAFGSTAAKTWRIASGSELLLNNTTTIETNGDHTLSGGGTVRLNGTMNVGQATAANASLIVNEGKVILDGGTLNSSGGYRIGSLASGSGAQTILTNGATMALTSSGSNIRVGDSANPNTSQLILDNSSLTMSGGIVAIPFAAGATGLVSQVGGTVAGCVVSFSDSGAGLGTYTIKNGTLQAIQIKKVTTAGSATLSLDNAILRTASGANSAFLTGLNSAQILSGGLTVDVTSDVTIGQGLSGSGALTKTGSSKLTLTGANTYTGNTLISAGTLAIGAGGSISGSPSITLPNGTTFDTTGSSYALTAAQTLIRDTNSGVASVTGTLALNSGAKISLQINGTNGSVGTISVTGGLTVNSNLLMINVANGPLDVGTYTLIAYTGTKSGSFNATPSITGAGIGMGLAAKIVETAGVISLKVYVPAHGVAAANIKVVESDLANTLDSVTVTTTLSVNGLQVRDGSSRGDYTVQVGSSGADDVASGVLITSIAENGRDHGEESGTNFCTSAISSTSSGYFIPTANAPDGKEYNINVSAAFFPYNKWLGGYARNSGGTNGGANNLLTASSGLSLGTHFVDNGGGVSTVNLTSLGIDSQDGVLMVVGGGNNNEYASTVANTNGTWSIYLRDNGTNGSATTQGPVAFAFIPKTNVSVISGKFQGDGTIAMYNGTAPRFSVTNTTNGTWQLSIPGYSSSKGVLVICQDGNFDNIISAQPSGSNWIIQSRDLPGLGLQTPSTTAPVCSFVFIPAPTATLVSPANNANNITSSPTLAVTANNPAGGKLDVTFYGHRAEVPGPGKDFLIPVLPDTQNYARENSGTGDATKEMWFAQTDWIVNNRVAENIAYVATLGDCVQNGDDKLGSPNNTEWRNATNAMYRLESQANSLLFEGIPYGVTVGNHDQTPAGDPDGSTDLYNQYFGTSHFSGKSYYGGHYSSNNDTWYDLFSAGGMDFLVFSFEYGRYGTAVLDWADTVAASYPTRRIIVLTHHAGDDTPDATTSSPFSTQGSAIYNSLKSNPNFFLMLGGHVFNEGGEGRRTDTFNGKTVRTLISDYQGRMNGGNGLMRLMYFSPSNNLVSVKTFSPYTGNYETDANSQFTFSYNMQPNGAGSAATAYVAISTNLDINAGSQASCVWSGLQASKKYEWYVVVTDEVGDYSTSTEWKFTTTTGFAGRGTSDADADGLPDVWQANHSVSDANADSDGDGQSNYSEYLANTDPTNPESLLKLLDAKTLVDGSVKLTWASVGGIRYRIQYSDGIGGAFSDLVRDAADEVDPSEAGHASTMSYTDSAIPANKVRFYRIKIVP